MRLVASIIFGLLVVIGFAMPAFAQTAEDDTKVRALIADWFVRVGQVVADAPWSLMAPGAIDAGPGYAEIYELPEKSRSGAGFVGPVINNELASKALKFEYDIDLLKLDPRFAKAVVSERGYFYAPAAQATYQIANSTIFLFEKMDDGRWLILAHEAKWNGIPSDTSMPDLRDTYYLRCGAACDSEADAKKAKEF